MNGSLGGRQTPAVPSGGDQPRPWPWPHPGSTAKDVLSPTLARPSLPLQGPPIQRRWACLALLSVATHLRKCTFNQGKGLPTCSWVAPRGAGWVRTPALRGPSARDRRAEWKPQVKARLPVSPRER